MAITEFAGSRFGMGSGLTLKSTEWNTDWYSPNYTGTGVVVILVVAVAADTIITENTFWQPISLVSQSGITESKDGISFPGGMTVGVYWQYEVWGGNQSNRFTWPVSALYQVAWVGFAGVSPIGTVNSLGASSGQNNILLYPQGFSTGQAGDLVLGIGVTRIGVNSSGTTYGPGTPTGGVGALPTTTYTDTSTGKPIAIRIGGALQTSAGQAVGGYQAPFTGHSGGAAPKLWTTNLMTFRATSSSTRRSFVYL